MDSHQHMTPTALHARLPHPILDRDGHWIQFEPTLLDYLKQVGGPTMVERYRRNEYSASLQQWARMTVAERYARDVYLVQEILPTGAGKITRLKLRE